MLFKILEILSQAWGAGEFTQSQKEYEAELNLQIIWLSMVYISTKHLPK